MLFLRKLQPKPEAEKEKAAVALDLSSDDQWPSISSRDESGSVQEVWLTSSEAKGWSDALKKTTPMVYAQYTIIHVVAVHIHHAA